MPILSVDQDSLITMKTVSAAEAGPTWNIESLRLIEGPAPTLQIAGWLLPDPRAHAIRIVAEGPSGRVELDRAQLRPDVVKAHFDSAEHRQRFMQCGFAGTFPAVEGAHRVLIEQDGDTFDAGSFRVGSPDVVPGSGGWLYLGNDTNRSITQFTTRYEPPPNWIAGWSDFLDGIERIGQAGGPNASLLIAPAKEEALPHIYPFAAHPQRLMARFLDLFGEREKLIWPLDALTPHGELCYDKGDTHWTEFGAWLAARELLESWGITLGDTAQPTFRVTFGGGDLSDKLHGYQRVARLVSDWPRRARVIFANEALHHGAITIYGNGEALRDETLVIFGASSSNALIPFLSEIFSRVVYCYTAGSVDMAIVRHERPQHVLCQSNQRFLTVAPTLSYDTRAAAHKKLAQTPPEARDALEERIQSYSSPDIDWYRSDTLRSLQAARH